MMLDWPDLRVLVTGGSGFLGTCVCRILRRRGVAEERLLLVRQSDYDLTNQDRVVQMYRDLKPENIVFERERTMRKQLTKV